MGPRAEGPGPGPLSIGKVDNANKCTMYERSDMVMVCGRGDRISVCLEMADELLTSGAIEYRGGTTR